jgi:hypothetical protein
MRPLLIVLFFLLWPLQLHTFIFRASQYFKPLLFHGQKICKLRIQSISSTTNTADTTTSTLFTISTSTKSPSQLKNLIRSWGAIQGNSKKAIQTTVSILFSVFYGIFIFLILFPIFVCVL